MSRDSISLSDLLVTVRARDLHLKVVNGKLAYAPKDRLSDDIRVALRTHREKIVPIVETWGPDTGLHILWFLYEAVPSEKPFQLDEGRRVVDPVKFFASIYFDIQAGPRGPRAHTGALQQDLCLIHGLLIANQREEIVQQTQGG